MGNKKNYTPELIREELFIDDVPVRTKFGVAHGGKGSSAEVARQAARALKNGEVEKLVLCGGKMNFDPLTLTGIMKFNASYFTQDGLSKAFSKACEFLSFKPEALLMADIAMGEGVDVKDIIVEGDWWPTSTNAAENVDNLLEDDALRVDLIKEGSLKVFGLVYNTRRLCGTWQRKLHKAGGQDVIIVPRSFYPYGFTSENWAGSKDIRERIVFPEMAKIDPANPYALIHMRAVDVAIFDEEKHRARALETLAPMNFPAHY